MFTCVAYSLSLLVRILLSEFGLFLVFSFFAVVVNKSNVAINIFVPVCIN